MDDKKISNPSSIRKYCPCCRTSRNLYHFSREEVGKIASELQRWCDDCLETSVVIFALWVSPASGNSLSEIQIMVGEFYDNEDTFLAAMSVIDIDHDPTKKITGISNLKNRKMRDQALREIVAGRGIPTHRNTHAIKTWYENDLPKGIKEPMNNLLASREVVDISILEPYIRELKTFRDVVNSGLFWGNQRDASRLSKSQILDACASRYNSLCQDPLAVPLMEIAAERRLIRQSNIRMPPMSENERLEYCFTRIEREREKESFFRNNLGVQKKKGIVLSTLIGGQEVRDDDSRKLFSDIGMRKCNMLLSRPKDSDVLSERECYVRANMVELFVVTTSDVQKFDHSGSRGRIFEGRVGIRCIQCANIAEDEKVPYSVAFPLSVEGIQGSVTRIQSQHFSKCKAIPDDIMGKYLGASDTRSGCNLNRAKDYWEKCAKEIGLRTLDENGMIETDGPVSDNSSRVGSDEDEEESTGEVEQHYYYSNTRRDEEESPGEVVHRDEEESPGDYGHVEPVYAIDDYAFDGIEDKTQSGWELGASTKSSRKRSRDNL